MYTAIYAKASKTLIDLQKFYNRKPEGLNGALQDLGINFEGREHSGMI